MQEKVPTQLRRHPRMRVSVPFPCSFARVGLKKWLTAERGGVGLVYDVSVKGARLMTEAAITPGDQIAVNLRLPNQASSTFVEVAVVRWGNDRTFGVEFENLSSLSAMRLQRFLTRVSKPQVASSR